MRTADFKGFLRLGNGRKCDPLTICDAYSRCLLENAKPRRAPASSASGASSRGSFVPPHRALGQQPPAAFYESSPRNLPSRPPS
ncbi:MAG TPA: hypothetical protein VM492_15410, partial [Sumerlaeia bacterium]|nr:hypothetical protein [Sumerlaeia bacterium]